jgi:lysophospholipase L1-like esterase
VIFWKSARDSQVGGRQMNDTAPGKSKPSRSSKRKWAFRAGAVLLSLCFFLLVECLCWMFDWGRPDNYDDPFVGFSDLQPLFVLDEKTSTYRISKSKQRFFAEDSFPAKKSNGTFRVFCLGGSTVRGRPFSIETSFTSWLEIGLNHADPGRKHEVINCGGVSYASYRLVPILKECLNYEPDLFVICTGHNEFLEDRTYGDVRDTSKLIALPHRNLARLRSYHLYRQALLSLTGGESDSPTATRMSGDVDAFLDYKRGLEAYHRDPVWRAGVIRHFEFNLNRMLQICAAHHIPAVLVLPPSNLADSMPFKSEHKHGMTPSKVLRWEKLVADARNASRTSPSAAIRLFEKSLELDDEYAMVHFQLGKLYEATEQTDLARAAFMLAREHDICPLRILSPMEGAIRQAASRWKVPLFDAHQLLEDNQSRDNEPLGAQALVDHVHPTIDGHQRIGEGLVRTLGSAKLIAQRSDWLRAARAEFRKHLDKLPAIYFPRGQQNLENLRFWTRGETDGPDIQERFPEKLQ